MKKIRVLWICSVSNPEIRSRLSTHISPLEPLMRRVVNRQEDLGGDSAIWNTNAINEMKKIPQVELHLVSPVRNLVSKRQDFEIDGIHYHFIRDENSSLMRKIIRYLFTRFNSQFKINRKNIIKIVREINPDIVHVIGAENPEYSLALLDVPKTIPTLLQLQALLDTIVDKTEGLKRKEYAYKAEYEKQLIARADYVGTRVPSFVDHIRKHISDNAVILNTTLAMAQNIDLTETKTLFDFVHYAALLNPSKATDIAIEAFGEVHKTYPGIKLDLVGGITDEFKQKLVHRITELGIESAVTFEGRLPTHEDVIAQVRKSRIALLPLKVSIIPNTIYEAMANGLPVVTTVTPGTPNLNSRRESVLISPADDVKDIASNMIKLIEDHKLYDKLRRNAAKTVSENNTNKEVVMHWVDAYKAIINNRNNGIPIPDRFLVK